MKAISDKAGKYGDTQSTLRSTTPGRLSQIEADHKIAGSHTIKTGVMHKAGQDNEAEHEVGIRLSQLMGRRVQSLLNSTTEITA